MLRGSVMFWAAQWRYEAFSGIFGGGPMHSDPKRLRPHSLWRQGPSGSRRSARVAMPMTRTMSRIAREVFRQIEERRLDEQQERNAAGEVAAAIFVNRCDERQCPRREKEASIDDDYSEATLVPLSEGKN
jgi:hypothetical protein